MSDKVLPKLKCHFDNKCNIDSITRKFCSRCRLDKCLAIGMRRDWILNEEERELKKLKILANKKRRDSNQYNNTSDESTKSLIDSSPETSHGNQISNTNNNTNNDILYEILDDNSISADALSEQIMDIESTAVEFTVSVIPIARPLSECNTGFNERETYLLNELITTARCMVTPFSSNIKGLDNMYDFHQTFATKFDRCIRNITTFVKGLSTFRDIYCEDQILLLKYGCLEVIFLRSIKCFDYTDNVIKIPMDPDNQIMSSITLFNPDIPNLANRDVIKEAQRKVTMEDTPKTLIPPLLQEIFDIAPAKTLVPYRDWILNEEEREMKKLKRLENKKWRDSHNSANNTSITCDESPQSLIYSSPETSHENHISNTNQTVNNDILYEILDDNNISADALSEQIRDIESTVTNDFIDNIVDNSFDKPNTSPPYVQQIACYNVSNKTIEKAVEFAVSVIPIAQPLSQCTAGFNEKEIYLMNELMTTIRCLGSPYSSNSRNLDNIYDYDYHQTVTTKFDTCIRNLTKVMKELTAFKNICCEDQISLLKYGCFDVIFLRSIMYFDYTDNVFKIPLMTSIAIFNPDRPNLANRDVIKDAQRKHMIEDTPKTLIPPLLEEVFDMTPDYQSDYSLTSL
ncbi:unnamed protein product [Oppiella nova]|uniref:Uncharacterized protein n=1 Tax=Oppiella nova TaxID=334625 RepID=A0A7R9LF21_9ACAR|nr:unnamed protein product [Oppiella nova]CAG2162219.1 unnamed protein product [Oppiella nova]